MTPIQTFTRLRPVAQEIIRNYIRSRGITSDGLKEFLQPTLQLELGYLPEADAFIQRLTSSSPTHHQNCHRIRKHTMKPNAKPKFINLHGITIPREWLTQNFVVTGTTGAGKSRGLLKPIIGQCVSQGDAAVIYDVKGDLLPIVQEALAACGRSKDLVTLGTGKTDVTFNPLGDEALATHQIVHQLLAAVSLTGPTANQRTSNEDLFWSSARTELLCALVELARQSLSGTGTNLNFSHLHRLRANLSQSSTAVLRWSKEVAAILPENCGASLVEFASLPENTRTCVINSVSSIIAPFLRAPLSDFVFPTAQRPAFQLTNLFDQSKVVVVTAGRRNHAPWFITMSAETFFNFLRGELPLQGNAPVAQTPKHEGQQQTTTKKEQIV